MKILISNSAKNWGGNELWSSSLANDLAEREHEVFFAFRTDIFKGRLAKKVNKIRLPFKHEFDFKTRGEIIKISESYGIDLFLATKRKEYYILGKCGRSINVPVVFRLGIHRKIPHYDIPQRYVFRYYPDAVIVNARAIKDKLINDKLCPEEKIHVIYNGYDFHAEYESYQNGLPSGKFIFAAAGRLSSQKGYDILLQACEILRKRTNNFFLAIAGEGPEHEAYQSFINSRNLQENVVLTGETDNTRGFFAASDAVIIPSRSEGIPNTLFEAWSVKKPVLASKEAGIPEAVNHKKNGFLFPLKPEEIADSMYFAISSSDALKKVSETAYNDLTTHFSKEIMLEKTESLFKSLTAL